MTQHGPANTLKIKIFWSDNTNILQNLINTFLAKLPDDVVICDFKMYSNPDKDAQRNIIYHFATLFYQAHE